MCAAILYTRCFGSRCLPLINLATQVVGVLGVAHGGTALATLTAHALYVGNGTSAPNAVGLGTTTTTLHGNASADPTFGAVALATDVSGSLAKTNDPNGIHNFSQAAQSQVTVAGTAYYITHSDLDMPAAYTTAIGAGTNMDWRTCMTKTAAGTVAFDIIIWKGTNGTSGDTAEVTQSIGVQTAAIDNMCCDVQLTFTSTTAAFWSINCLNKAITATGFGVATGATAFITGTLSGLTTTTASDKYGIGFESNTGTPTIVVSRVRAEAFGVN